MKKINPNRSPRTPFTFFMLESDLKSLEKIASDRDTTVSAVIREAIESEIKSLKKIAPDIKLEIEKHAKK